MGAVIGCGVRRHSRVGPPVKPKDGGMGMDGRDGMEVGAGCGKRKGPPGFPGGPSLRFPPADPGSPLGGVRDDVGGVSLTPLPPSPSRPG